MRSVSVVASARGRREERRGRTHLPGEPGIWLFVIADLLVFALFFGVILYARARQPAVFDRGQATLHEAYGGVMTLLLLTSSLLVAAGVRALRGDTGETAPRAEPGHVIASRLLAGALVCAGGFAVLKAVEYGTLAADGRWPTASDFYMYFFVFTLLHLAHVVIGSGVLQAMRRSVARPGAGSRKMVFVEIGATYWHMVDLIWLVLFALFYLVR